MKIYQWKSNLLNSELSSSAKLTGICISEYYREGKDCYPSLSTIMLLSSYTSPNTVREAIKELKEENFLIVKEKKIKHSGGRPSNLYLFCGVNDKYELSNNDSSTDSSNNDSSYNERSNNDSSTDSSKFDSSKFERSTDSSTDSSTERSKFDSKVTEVTKVTKTTNSLSVFLEKRILNSIVKNEIRGREREISLDLSESLKDYSLEEIKIILDEIKTRNKFFPELCEIIEGLEKNRKEQKRQSDLFEKQKKESTRAEERRIINEAFNNFKEHMISKGVVEEAMVTKKFCGKEIKLSSRPIVDAWKKLTDEEKLSWANKNNQTMGES